MTDDTHNVPEVVNIFNGVNSQFLTTVQITSDHVYDKIIKLKDGKAPGDNGFVPEFLKCLANVVSVPLAVIYNK